jgi:hypothetical protein
MNKIIARPDANNVNDKSQCTTITTAPNAPKHQPSWFEKDLDFPGVPYVARRGKTKKGEGPKVPRLSGNTKIAYRLCRSLNWDKNKIKIFQKYHPVELDQVRDYVSSNGHPLAASARNVLEAAALSKCLQTAHDAMFSHGWIMDVGGNSTRHARMKRDNVWSCNPNFLACESTKHVDRNSCTHRAQECQCVEPLVSMSVHSLYYFEPGEIVDLIKSTKLKRHYAVMHDYSQRPKSLFEGELEIMYDDDTMAVKSAGNSTSYIHPYPKWYTPTGQFQVGKYVLHAKIERTLMDDHLYLFTISEGEAYTPSFDYNVVYREICEETYKLAGLVDSYTVTRFTRDVGVHAREKGLSSYYAQQYAMEWMMREAPHIRNPDVVPLNAEVAMSIRNNLFGQLRSSANSLQRAADYVWRNKYKAGAAAAVVAGAYMQGRRLEKKITGKNRATVLTPIVAVGFAAAACLGYGFKNLSIRASLSQREKYAAVDYCLKSPQVEVDRNKTKSKIPTCATVPCKARVRAHPMVFMPGHVPAYPRSCHHNYHSAITKRMLNVTEFDEAEWEKVGYPGELVEAARYAKARIVPLSFQQWISRFPASKQKALRRELGRDQVYGCKFNDTKVFLKFEAMKDTTKAPRNIGANPAAYSYLIGRWIIPMSELVAEWLNEGCRFYFPLHASNEEIAEYILPMNEMLENDFSSFDATQNQCALGMVYDYYEMCGMPTNVVDMMRRDTFNGCKITTSVGISFHQRNSRISGRGDTLFGNTILSFVAMNYSTAGKVKRIIAKGDDSVMDGTGILHSDCLRKLEALGFKAKLVEKTASDVEFCSMLLVPVADGHVMSPKIGRLLTKTLWCKNTHLNEQGMKEQFAGTIKGLETMIAHVPVLRNFLRHPLVRGCDADKIPVNQYKNHTSRKHRPCAETYSYYAKRYNVDESLLADHLHRFDGFPVMLDQPLYDHMADVDWGDESNGHLLSVKTTSKIDAADIFVVPILEELFKYTFGMFGTVSLGLIESLLTKSLYNFMGHILLSRFDLPTAMAIHICHNFLVYHFKGPYVKPLSMAKNRKKKRNTKKQGQKQKQNKNVTFADLGKQLVAQGLRKGGGFLGNLVAPGVGGQFGTELGASISRIAGFGDYTVHQNTLQNVPRFGSLRTDSIRVRNVEFIDTVDSSVAFSTRSFTLNPANSDVTPWLATLANAYQQWIPHGIVFCFESTSATAIGSTNTALGTIALSSNYDIAEADYINLREVLASYFSSSGPPSRDLMHAIECDPALRPSRVLNIDHSGESGDDPALYNLCKTQVSTEGMQAVSTVGKLWISYDIELLKPRLASEHMSSIVANAAWTADYFLGLIQTASRGTPLPITATGVGFDTIHLDAYKGQKVTVTVTLTGTSLSSVAATRVYGTGITPNQLWNQQSASQTFNNTSSTVVFQDSVNVLATNGTVPTIEYQGSISSGTPSYVTIVVSAFPAASF